MRKGKKRVVIGKVKRVNGPGAITPEELGKLSHQRKS